MTDEITENGYTEGSYGLFGIAVFYGAPGTRNNLAYSIVWVRVYPQRENGDFASVFRHSEKSPFGQQKNRYIRAFRRRHLFCLRIML